MKKCNNCHQVLKYRELNVSSNDARRDSAAYFNSFCSEACAIKFLKKHRYLINNRFDWKGIYGYVENNRTWTNPKDYVYLTKKTKKKLK